MKAAVITISDRGSAGEREDDSGRLLKKLLADLPAEVVAYRVIPDEEGEIAEVVVEAASLVGQGVILTTGGTGLSPRDRTPEAIRPFISEEFPGIMEALRREGRKRTPYASLSRGIAGRVDRAIVVTLPGSPRAVQEAWTILGDLFENMLSAKMLL